MSQPHQSPPAVPDPGRKPFDWLRIIILVLVFGALTFAVTTRYTGKAPGEPYREPLRAFFAAARTRDSLRLRAMVSADPPLQWALAAAAQVPSPIPEAEDRVEVAGLHRNGDTTSLMVWAATVCGRQPFFITMVNQAGRQRVLDLRTECDSSTRHDSAGRP